MAFQRDEHEIKAAARGDEERDLSKPVYAGGYKDGEVDRRKWMEKLTRMDEWVRETHAWLNGLLGDIRLYTTSHSNRQGNMPSCNGHNRAKVNQDVYNDYDLSQKRLEESIMQGHALLDALIDDFQLDKTSYLNNRPGNSPFGDGLNGITAGRGHAANKGDREFVSLSYFTGSIGLTGFIGLAGLVGLTGLTVHAVHTGHTGHTGLISLIGLIGLVGLLGHIGLTAYIVDHSSRTKADRKSDSGRH
ncbi:collagen alpha-6(IV) chain, putative [Babesia ovata]|uniref:Collagen alpha-6(IV) chain, putative n=1 Tax=Babesia ovata TaxID=189622 RepID=A0A2H6KDP5_9APIC|nr:collagen alpha-6(IV) chain, putative [Babesia ovata]GBE61111.1 collagen alpha-6(IV) chain, putative [Babesia ovata]